MNLLQNFDLPVIQHLCRGRRAVPLQTFTTRHSNRKLSIVMVLSTTFKQCTPETTKFGKWHKIRAILPFNIIQGHWFWYQSKAHTWLPISDDLLTYLLSCTICEILRNVINRYIWLPVLHLNPPTEGFNRDNRHKIFSECQWMAKM